MARCRIRPTILIDGSFDVSTAVFVDAFSVSSEETDPTGITFSSDGIKMFVIGSMVETR